MITILMLLSDKPSQSALPFLVGWVLGCIALITLGTAVANSIPQPRPRQSDTTAGVIEIVLGALLLVLSARAVHRRSETTSGRARTWANAVGGLGLLKSLGLGLALNIRPKGLLLGAAASLVLRSAKLGVEETAILVLVYTAIATSTV